MPARLFRDLIGLPAEFRQGAVTIGNFDGVHLGHAKIVGQLVAAAERVGGKSLVFTFDPHPAALLRPDAVPPPLTTLAQRADLLAQLGVDAVLAYPTDQELLSLEPEAFYEQIVIEKLAARAIVEGPNFFFGRDRRGNVELLRQLADQTGVDLEVVAPVDVDGVPTSSSRIRQCLSAGRVEEAARLLGRRYEVTGTVVAGARRGAKLGFPTANIEQVPTALPALGVYAGFGQCGDACWPAAINLGPNPTFGEQQAKLEVHLLGCHQDLYEHLLTVQFVERLRDVRTFSGPDDLKSQIEQDVAAVRALADRGQTSLEVSP